MSTRTKRRYAHELYPHAEEGEVRPLAVEVPYMYARAFGFNVTGTSWFEPLRDPETGAVNKEAAERTGNRSALLVAARERALLADALLQGLGGQEAWDWAEQRMDPEGEFLWERAVHYGVNPDAIKPYPCGPEPDRHDHWTVRSVNGWRTLVEVVACRESECPDCCEQVQSESSALVAAMVLAEQAEERSYHEPVSDEVRAEALAIIDDAGESGATAGETQR